MTDLGPEAWDKSYRLALRQQEVVTGGVDPPRCGR